MPDQNAERQAHPFRAALAPRLRALLISCLLAAVFFLPLAACGKKPSSVDPPQGEDNDTFPLTYPDPATDPKP